MLAEQAGHVELVRLLREAGADTKLKQEKASLLFGWPLEEATLKAHLC